MYDAIAVPTDGSDTARAATEWAIALASRFDATVHVVHVVELGELPAGVDSEGGGELAERGEEAVARTAELAAEAGVECTTDVFKTDEPVHETIVDFAHERGLDCIVMGTHGRTGLDRLLLGSVTERTLRVSPLPVITVHENVDPDTDLETILVPTDGSEGSVAAVGHAIDLTATLEAALHTIHVVDLTGVWSDVDAAVMLEALQESGQRAVDAVVERANAAELRSVEASVLSGTPSRAIVDYVNERDVDCVVMGTHGRTGLDRYLLGSVTERVVRLADVPVISVKAPDVAEEFVSG